MLTLRRLRSGARDEAFVRRKDEVPHRVIGPQIVMATAIGHGVDDVRPFLRSLRRCGYSGPVVLYVDGKLKRVLEKELLASNIHLIRSPRWRPEMLDLEGQRRRWRILWRPIRVALWLGIRLGRHLPPAPRCALQSAVAGLLYFPTESRHFRYRRFLRRNSYDRVLLTDVRDVLFQSDPFLALPPLGLAVGVEVEAYTLETEPQNAQWLRLAYGDRVLADIGANPVSCAGVTHGQRDAIVRYLDLMVTELEGLSVRAAGRPGIDQALHNALVWTGQVQPLHLLRTLTSTVATLNGLREEDVSLSPAGTVVNRDGSEPSVVHQYHRVPGLEQRLLRSLTV